jgi:hypothetical protein
VAYTIAAIAQWDFPDEWPELFDLLMAALKDPNQFAVQVPILLNFHLFVADFLWPVL